MRPIGESKIEGQLPIQRNEQVIEKNKGRWTNILSRIKVSAKDLGAAKDSGFWSFVKWRGGLGYAKSEIRKSSKEMEQRTKDLIRIERQLNRLVDDLFSGRVSEKGKFSLEDLNLIINEMEFFKDKVDASKELAKKDFYEPDHPKLYKRLSAAKEQLINKSQTIEQSLEKVKALFNSELSRTVTQAYIIKNAKVEPLHADKLFKHVKDLHEIENTHKALGDNVPLEYRQQLKDLITGAKENLQRIIEKKETKNSKIYEKISSKLIDPERPKDFLEKNLTDFTRFLRFKMTEAMFLNNFEKVNGFLATAKDDGVLDKIKDDKKFKEIYEAYLNSQPQPVYQALPLRPAYEALPLQQIKEAPPPPAPKKPEMKMEEPASPPPPPEPVISAPPPPPPAPKKPEMKIEEPVVSEPPPEPFVGAPPPPPPAPKKPEMKMEEPSPPLPAQVEAKPLPQRNVELLKGIREGKQLKKVEEGAKQKPEESDVVKTLRGRRRAMEDEDVIKEGVKAVAEGAAQVAEGVLQVALRPFNEVAKAARGAKPDALLQEVQKGMTLRKVKKEEVNQKPATDQEKENWNIDMLSRALLGQKQQLGKSDNPDWE